MAARFPFFFHSLWLTFALLVPLWAPAQSSEADYIRLIHRYLGGQTEVSVYGGRADIVNSSHAIEVEYASKWKEAIGQSLWYAIQTNKRPGIVLIKRSTADNKYVIMLQSTLDYAKLDTRVWVWPDDFKQDGGVDRPADQAPGQGFLDLQTPTGRSGKCWMTTSSGIRHNASCRYYNHSRGKFVDCNAGRACKVCGG